MPETKFGEEDPATDPTDLPTDADGLEPEAEADLDVEGAGGPEGDEPTADADGLGAEEPEGDDLIADAGGPGGEGDEPTADADGLGDSGFSAGPDDWTPAEPPPADTPPARKVKAGGAARAGSSPKASTTATKALRDEKSGRATPKGGTPQPVSRSGRYTPPIPKEKRQSPPWFPWVLLGFLLLGLLTIVLNYVNVLPGGTNNWYLIGGIVAIVVGLFMATFYH